MALHDQPHGSIKCESRLMYCTGEHTALLVMRITWRHAGIGNSKRWLERRKSDLRITFSLRPFIIPSESIGQTW